MLHETFILLGPVEQQAGQGVAGLLAEDLVSVGEVNRFGLRFHFAGGRVGLQGSQRNGHGMGAKEAFLTALARAFVLQKAIFHPEAGEERLAILDMSGDLVALDD